MNGQVFVEPGFGKNDRLESPIKLAQQQMMARNKVGLGNTISNEVFNNFYNIFWIPLYLKVTYVNV
jgi:hypothetical protein